MILTVRKNGCVTHDGKGCEFVSRIVFISPYRDLSVLARSVAKELGMDEVEFYEGWLEQAAKVIDALSGPPVDIVISRGGTADYIARHYHVPVVPVNTGPFDLIECCLEAQRYGNNIAITSFGRPLVGTRLLEHVMHITITDVVFTSLTELRRKIADLAADDGCCIVGGGPSVTYARECGLPSVFLRTSGETIKEALLRAAELARLHQEEKHKAYRLKAILDCAYDGIIAVDGQGKVEIFNAAAERIMGLAATQVVGTDVRDSIPNTRLDEVLKTGRSEINEFQDIGTERIVTSRVPVKDGERVIGAVATFQEFARVVHAERRMRREMRGHRFTAHYTLRDVIGQSPVMKSARQLAESYAASDLTVFIYGPSGTGKELFAQGIHNASQRAAQPFVAVNCGALPPTLLESELFGYEEGAFTGAKRKGKHGLFELAHGGTIFLDEVDALPVELQGRLLRVLQEREVLRIGGESIIPIDVRVIAATNQPPTNLLHEKKLREDLFYRLNVLYLELPPLAQHRDDIPLLCQHFLGQHYTKRMVAILSSIMPYLLRYTWPGNIRELYNFTQRLNFFQEKFHSSVSAHDFLQAVAPNIIAAITPRQAASGSDLRTRLVEQENAMILQTLAWEGSVAKAAAALGIGKSTLWRKLKKIRQES